MTSDPPPDRLQSGVLLSHYRITGERGPTEASLQTVVMWWSALEARRHGVGAPSLMREMRDWFDRFLGPVNAVPH